MKNKSLNLKKLIYAFFILGMVSLVGCKREELGLHETSGIKKFFQENQPKSEFFVVNAGVKSSIKCKKGTVIKIDANSLLHQNGTPVTGNVTIEMKEVFTKSEMVKSKISTVSQGRLLISQGEFYINAVQGGESLKIKSGKKINISVPNFSNAPSSMLFRGDSIPNDSTPDPTDTIIDWTLFDSTYIPPIFIDSTNDSIFDSINNPTITYFNFLIEGFGWINLDEIENTQDMRSLNIVVNGFDVFNCNVFIVYKDIHSMFEAWYGLDVFNAKYITLNRSVTIVAIGLKEGQYYSTFKDLTVTKDESISLDMNPTTENEINQTLESL